jgi:hypothetical protein
MGEIFYGGSAEVVWDEAVVRVFGLKQGDVCAG